MSPHKRQNSEEIEERGLKSLLDLHPKIIRGGVAGIVERKREKEKQGGCVSFYLMRFLKGINAKYLRSHSVSLKKCHIFLAMAHAG